MVRIKHRYLLLNILYPDASPVKASPSIPLSLSFRAPSPSHLSPGLFIAHLRTSISVHFGDCGLGLTTASLKVVYLSTATSTVIIRCSRQHFRIVWAALTFMNELPAPRKGDSGKKCVLQVVRVSGTIRKSEEELLRRAKAHVVRAKLAEEADDLGALERLLEEPQSGSGKTQQPGLSDDFDDGIEDASEEDEMDDLSD